jgi:hypothetical protein
MIDKLKNQNDKLKNELRMLTMKLEEFVEKAKLKKTAGMDKKKNEPDEILKSKKLLSKTIAKENELKASQNKIHYYKKEIAAMRRQLEGSYNIEK